MTDLVPRTVTEIGVDGLSDRRTAGSADQCGVPAGGESTDWTIWLDGEDSRARSEPSRTLEAFRECDAYVMLGAPGAGKTTTFKTEAEPAGCHYVTARDFLTLGERPGWREPDATLFIDGLDEKRAGSADGRTPLDDIRAKLDALGRPRFRLSCRDADWFGANDRTHLDQVTKGGKVKVLRLEPLSDRDIRELLAHHSGIDCPDTFMQEARERGIDHLLTNPQTLNMLADAVAGGTWPGTRTETLELACEKLAQEFNPEHRLANRDGPTASEVLAAAGRLCAILLLTGRAGYATNLDGDGSGYLALGSIPNSDHATLRLALNTLLFVESSEESRRVPTHRQIAEFLAARYLAELINDGLPIRRVLALMTGGDGEIVSELQGLSAWLAAHCPRARPELIERDPGGIAAYGDSGVFTQVEKQRLLEYLCPPDPSLDASLFTSLVTPDMAPVLRELLRERTRDDQHQDLVVFLLCVLANAAPLPELADVLFELAASEDRSPSSRRWAAICLAIGVRKLSARFGTVVRRLLNGLKDGSIRDDGKRLLGELLEALYPTFIGPDEIFDYWIPDSTDTYDIGNPANHYDFFWRHVLADASRSEDLLIVLDQLEDVFHRCEEWKLTGEPPDSALAHVAGMLVAKTLDQLDVEEPARTLVRLRLTGGGHFGDPESLQSIRDWIEARPERYMALLRENVARCRESPDFDDCISRAMDPLHGAKVPSDYGRWCLGEAERVGPNVNLAKFWFEEAWYALLRHDGSDGLALEHLEALVRSQPQLVRVFEGLRSTEIQGEPAATRRRTWQHNRERRRKRERELADWRRFFGQHEEALRENRCPAGVLNRLAEAYLGSYLDIEGENGSERLRNLLGDETLVKSAMVGLRGAVHRHDLPTPKEVLALRVDNQRHLLAFPVSAGLDLMPGDSIATLDDSRARVAVALLVASRPPSPGPAWVRPLFESRPNVVAEEIVRFAAAALRRGEQQVSFVYEMLDHEWLSEVARIACPGLLRAFPVRAPRHLFNVLTRMLWWGADNLEASAMEPIVLAKLAAMSMTAGQRAYWHAAQLVVSSEPNLAGVEAFAEKHANALSGLFAFYQRPPDQTSLLGRLPSPSLGRLARLLGATSHPLSAVRSEPREVIGSELVRVILKVLGTRAEDDALRALAELSDDSRMAAWHTIVQRVQREQRVVRRGACYQHPNVGALIQSLDSRQPANVADLAALTSEHISAIARNIRDGYTNDWRQYWARGGESWRPAHEDDCRDALLSDLQAKLLPLGVEAAPEGRYADEKRSDIRISFGGFNVPVEIKKSSNRELWRAIRNQLITKYTRDPGSAGYGIYLVFWFGNDPDPCQMPESGLRPRSAAELEERLRATLTSEEARLNSICVIDVARP